MNTALIVLMLTYVTPPDEQDIHKQMKQPSLEQCWDNAKAFVEEGIPPELKKRGVIALTAGCLVREIPEEKL